MVKRVPRSPTRLIPSPLIFTAVASAMWRSGIEIPSWMAGATKVHGIGANHEEVGPAPLQGPGVVHQDLTETVPLTPML